MKYLLDEESIVYLIIFHENKWWWNISISLFCIEFLKFGLRIWILQDLHMELVVITHSFMYVNAKLYAFKIGRCMLYFQFDCLCVEGMHDYTTSFFCTMLFKSR